MHDDRAAKHTAIGSNFGFSILPKDTSTCGGTGDWKANLAIRGQSTLLPEPQLSHLISDDLTLRLTVTSVSSFFFFALSFLFLLSFGFLRSGSRKSPTTPQGTPILVCDSRKKKNPWQ